MTGGLIDSSVLIDCLQGRVEAIAFLAAHAATGRPATHLIVAAELLAGARDKLDEETLVRFLCMQHSTTREKQLMIV